MRVLIADDSRMVRRQLRRLLETQLRGAVVEEAEDGRQAVDKLIQAFPDIVIVDVAMPTLNGLGATEQITAIAPDIPVVVYTMYATPQIEREAKNRGAKAVVSKDEVGTLVSVIEQLLPTTRTQRPA
jgi:two-component system, NarL family, response regulator DesR